jgi:hypothetical protein
LACDAEVACAILGDEEQRTVGNGRGWTKPGASFLSANAAEPSREEKRINPLRDDLVALNRHFSLNYIAAPE